jgi:glycosyltransferase involved in cell wall biosynthesis
MSKPVVHILLATCHGRAFLQEQLDSIASQTYSNWDLLVSDDGSTDGTREIVIAFAKKNVQKITLVSGPCKGSAHNFFHLINLASTTETNCLFSFCDQDDVWLPQKLARSIKHFESTQNTERQPYLYCSRTQVVDENLRVIGLSNVPRRPLAFGNALLQNVASGNTMIFNEKLLHILRLIKPHHSVLHDWTAYQVATGCDGIVHFDSEPTLLYRQHRGNLVGINSGLVSSFRRLLFLFRGGYKRWACKTELALSDVTEFLTPASKELFGLFCKVRSTDNMWHRFLVVMRGDLWCQSRSGTVVHMGAIVLRFV